MEITLFYKMSKSMELVFLGNKFRLEKLWKNVKFQVCQDHFLGEGRKM